VVSRHRIRVAAIVGALALPLALGGCVTATACVSWVDHETPQDAFDDAAAVVTAEAEATGTTTTLFGAQVPLYELTIDEVLKGPIDPGSLDVASTQVTCSAAGQEYPPGGDQLDAAGELIVFLYRDDDGHWRTMTPFDAALPLPDDGTLPFESDDH
jgi:hypothetical protein